MLFNPIIDRLRKWCIGKAEVYQKAYAQYGGAVYVGCQIAYELEFKLSARIDKDFESTEAFKKEIHDLINVHYIPSVITPSNRSAQYVIDKTNREFLDCFEDLLSADGSFAPANIPYKRVIVGAEADALKNKFSSVWKYENTSCWFPLMGEEPKEIKDKFFVMLDRFVPYGEQICSLIGLPKAHIYGYGEYIFSPEHCIETSELNEYDGCEMLYTDKDFSWAIYFSHENTVSFAGAIVPKAQELLAQEKPYWNRFI